MKIIKLSAENIKKLTAVEITPRGDVIEITGANGAGKSSVLDAIMWALAGGDSIQDMPIEGLSVDENVVTFRGLPLEQASQAEQLRVSLAMAMVMNPELRVIRITDGSLLDNDSMAAIAEQAKDHDFQIWIEVVDDTGTVGVYIEDGQVAADNQAA